MSVRTHASSWRSLLAFAPALGAAFIVMGALQGEPAILLSRTVYLVLLPVSLAGWWIARQLARVMSGRPVVPIAQAMAGDIALRGQAQPMPGRASLTSPKGNPCVWYRHSEQGLRSSDYHASDSAQPFLLVDASGACIVLPAGADITGGHEDESLGGRERLILAGDTIYVAGRFKPASSETVQQLQDIEPDEVRVAVTVSTDNPDDMRSTLERGEKLFRDAQAARAAGGTEAAAAGRAHAPLALPVVCAPDFGPFIVTAKDGATEAGWYGLLEWINLAVLLAAIAMLSYLVLAVR